MASEISIERRVKHRYRAGQYCGSVMTISVSLPQKQHRRLDRARGWAPSRLVEKGSSARG